MAIYLPYTDASRQTVLGHYATAQTSGLIVATPTALDAHASIRWAPSLSNAYLVLMRLKMGWGVSGAVTASVRIAYQASIARQFTVDFTTAATALNLATTAKTNTMRSGTMSNSLMGANGPRIATTTVQSGQTYTLDAAPFALTDWVVQPAGNATVTQALGVAGETKTVYEWTGLGQHPVVLGNNEGIAVQLTHTGWASGTYQIYTQWEWAEVLTF